MRGGLVAATLVAGLTLATPAVAGEPTDMLAASGDRAFIAVE